MIASDVLQKNSEISVRDNAVHGPAQETHKDWGNIANALFRL